MVPFREALFLAHLYMYIMYIFFCSLKFMYLISSFLVSFLSTDGMGVGNEVLSYTWFSLGYVISFFSCLHHKFLIVTFC